MAKSKNAGKGSVAQVQDKDERRKALDAAMAQIEKQFGQGAVMRLGDKSQVEIDTIPTGALTLDIALGIGGLPRGRIIEIYGPESSGKTTVALHCVAEAQKMGGTCAFIDAEHALDPVYAGNIGVDVDNLLLSQPDTGEQALEICETLVRSGCIDVVVIDSVAALVPRAEIEGEMGDSHVGLQARLMSQALRKLAPVVSKSNTICIFINQLREKVGVMFGNPETTPGGRALKFYASVRLDVRKVETLRKGTDVVGSHTRVKVVKNKVAPPFKDKNGSWFAYNGAKIAQGRDAAKQYLIDHPDIKDEIEDKIRESYMPADDDDIPAGAAADAAPEEESDDDDILGIDV